MIIDKNIAKMICELEYRIGNQTYNPNSYNGFTGDEGCGFKYPVNYCKNKTDMEKQVLSKTKSPIDTIDPECIGTMRYAFGSNHLYIGDGIASALEYLEEIYGIDFNKMEEKRTEKRKKALAQLEKQLGERKSVTVSSGTNIVGIDLPIGKFVIKEAKDVYSNYLMVYINDENGELVGHVFNSGEDVEFKEGYIVKSSDHYILETKTRD